MLLSEIFKITVEPSDIEKEMSEYGSSVSKFRDLIGLIGLPDEKDEIEDVRYIGLTDSGYAYAVQVADMDTGGTIITRFIANFKKDGTITGDFSSEIEFNFDEFANVDDINKAFNKMS